MRRRPQAPKMRSLVIATSALRNYIPSSEPTTQFDRSEKGVPFLRYQAETRGMGWSVDIYMGHFYRVRVGSGFGEVKRSIPELLTYLMRKLQVHPESPEEPSF